MEGDFNKDIDHFKQSCKLTRQKRLVEAQKELVRHQYSPLRLHSQEVKIFASQAKDLGSNPSGVIKFYLKNNKIFVIIII